MRVHGRMPGTRPEAWGGLSPIGGEDDHAGGDVSGVKEALTPPFGRPTARRLPKQGLTPIIKQRWVGK